MRTANRVKYKVSNMLAKDYSMLSALTITDTHIHSHNGWFNRRCWRNANLILKLM